MSLGFNRVEGLTSSLLCVTGESLYKVETLGDGKLHFMEWVCPAEFTQQLKCLLHKQKDQNSSIQNSQKYQLRVVPWQA